MRDWRWVDGAAFSERFGDVYHTRAGALGQAETVFLRGVGLPERWRGRRHFALLENGFGFGVNFFVTWRAWQHDPGRCAALDYVAIDAFPRDREEMGAFWRQYENDPRWRPLVAELLEQYPLPIPGFHRLWLDGGRVRLTLVWHEAMTAVEALAGRFDALYLDGFSPAKNPEMWSESLLGAFAKRLASGARVASWCTAGRVRRALAANRLEVRRCPGFGGKRERLEAVAPAYGPPPRTVPKQVAVVGGGLAGASVAVALAERGVAVTLFDAHSGPAQGASGNCAGAARWLPSFDDNLWAQWTRTGLLTLRSRWPRWAALGAIGRWCGALQIAKSAAHEARMRAVVAQLALPESLLTWVTQSEASARAGVTTRFGGWWFPCGGWVTPPALVAAWLRAYPLATIWSAQVTAITPTENGWRVAWRPASAADTQGASVRSMDCDAVVLATGAGAVPSWPRSFVQDGMMWGAMPAYPGAPLPLHAVRGQVSCLPHPREARPRVVVTGSGYLIPPERGFLLFGATATPDDWHPTLRQSDHEANWQRLQAMVDWQPTDLAMRNAGLAGRVAWRAATQDHLPIVGALAPSGRWDDPKRWHSGLWVFNGLGARGIAIAALAGELLAAQIADEPWPVSRRLAAAVDPARFVRRRNLLHSPFSDS